MKISFLALGLFISIPSFSQIQPLLSKVYSFENTHAENTKKGTIKTIFNGSGGILSTHSTKVITLEKGKKMNYKNNNTAELFIIVKDGPISFTLNDKITELVRGSIVCVMPGDVLLVSNTGETTVSYYAMSYISIAPINKERAVTAGGSFIINWNDIAFKAHDRGGVRQFFIRPTAMLSKFDIHVTTLNQGKKSHEPHTHTNEEIILMLDGNGEMQIGTEHQRCKGGDVVFLKSMVLHNITNIGDKPATYYAIQWN
jgi:(S)-ureidoglycine aminohydrolase